MSVLQSGGYAEGLAARRVRFQRCAACGAAQTLARYVCVSCRHETLEWADACGHGVVNAVTVVSRAPSDLFRALAPYMLVIVTLEEGARVMGHGTPDLAIGQAVTAGFFDHGGQTLLRFGPRSDDPTAT